MRISIEKLKNHLESNLQDIQMQIDKLNLFISDLNPVDYNQLHVIISQFKDVELKTPDDVAKWLLFQIHWILICLEHDKNIMDNSAYLRNHIDETSKFLQSIHDKAFMLLCEFGSLIGKKNGNNL